MMHKVLHNFGDWELETRHMTRIEKSIYLDMRTLYLKDGKPLTDDLPLLERLLMCHSDDEKQALAFLLSHKFRHDQKSHSYRNSEWDLILKNYKFRHKNDGTTTDNDGTNDGTPTDRKKAFRERQKKLIELLKQNGIQANSRMPYGHLVELCKTHRIAITDGVVTHNDGTPTDMTEQKNDVKKRAITINHKIYNKLASKAKNEKINPQAQKTATNTQTAPTPNPEFTFSQAQRDTCTAKGMNIDETFAKFSQFYTAKGFNCAQTTWIRMFDNWISKERLPKSQTHVSTPDGGDYLAYLRKISAENKAFAREHGL